MSPLALLAGWVSNALLFFILGRLYELRNSQRMLDNIKSNLLRKQKEED